MTDRPRADWPHWLIFAILLAVVIAWLVLLPRLAALR